jgi:hypothetical protein
MHGMHRTYRFKPLFEGRNLAVEDLLLRLPPVLGVPLHIARNIF